MRKGTAEVSEKKSRAEKAAIRRAIRRERREGVARVNEFFGTDITVSFDSAWLENEKEEQAVLTGMETPEEQTEDDVKIYPSADVSDDPIDTQDTQEEAEEIPVEEAEEAEVIEDNNAAIAEVIEELTDAVHEVADAITDDREEKEDAESENIE